MIYVDTGAWYALFVPRDPDHVRAVAWIADNRGPLVTTDYVLDELLTLLKRRGQSGYVQRAGRALFGGELGTIEWVRWHRHCATIGVPLFQALPQNTRGRFGRRRQTERQYREGLRRSARGDRGIASDALGRR